MSRVQALQGPHGAGAARGHRATNTGGLLTWRVWTPYGPWEANEHSRDPAWHDVMECDGQRESSSDFSTDE